VREIFTHGSVGRAPGNWCLYPDIYSESVVLRNAPHTRWVKTHLHRNKINSEYFPFLLEFVQATQEHHQCRLDTTTPWHKIISSGLESEFHIRYGTLQRHSEAYL
jgi:hypothetical protein